MGTIHVDVCDPMITPTRGGYSYFKVFTDEYNHYRYVYLMKHARESVKKFNEFQMKYRINSEARICTL